MTAPTVSPLPTPPSRGSSPETFNAEADAFLGALPTLQSEVNAVATWIDTTANTVGENAASSQEWAEGPGEPGGPGTKSAKGHAEDAAASASAAETTMSSLNSTEIIGRSTLTNPSSLAAGYRMLVWGDAVDNDGALVEFRYDAIAAGTFKIGMCNRSGDTYTFDGNEVSIVCPGAGLQTATVSIAATAGQYLAYAEPATKIIKHSSNTADGVGYLSNGIANGTAITDSSLDATYRVEAGGSFRRQIVTATTFTEEVDSRVDNDRQIERMLRRVDDQTRLMACFGDSRANQNFSGTVLVNTGYMFWTASLTNQRVRPATFNLGVGGETTTQFVARLSTAKRCPAQFILIPGWINDIIQGVSSATTQANLTQIMRELSEVGKTVLMCNDYPASGLTSPQMTAHQAIRNWVDTQGNAAARTYIVNTWDAMATTAGGTTIQASALTDGIHPSPLGSYLASQPINTLINTLLLDPLLLDSLQVDYAVNGALEGTNGTKSSSSTGDVATDWTLSSSQTKPGSGTLAGSKVTVNGRAAQRLQFSGTGWSTGSRPDMLFTQSNPTTINPAQFSVGDEVEVCFLVQVASGTSGIRAIFGGFYYKSGGLTSNGDQLNTNTYPSAAHTLLLRHRFVLPSDFTRIQPVLLVYGIAGQQPNVDLTITEIQVTKV